MINGITQLIMMKADVLSIFDTIKICTHYNYNGKKIDYLPFDVTTDSVSPVYTEMKGWNKDLTGITNMDAAPSELVDYIEYIEKELNIPITIVSVGPDRKQTIIRKKELVYS